MERGTKRQLRLLPGSGDPRLKCPTGGSRLAVVLIGSDAAQLADEQFRLGGPERAFLYTDESPADATPRRLVRIRIAFASSDLARGYRDFMFPLGYRELRNNPKILEQVFLFAPDESASNSSITAILVKELERVRLWLDHQTTKPTENE